MGYFAGDGQEGSPEEFGAEMRPQGSETWERVLSRREEHM